jgi:hypothetical protein
VADCFDTLNDADMTSGRCISPVAYVILCVRFISLVHACRSHSRLQRSARNATLDTGGWLDLMKFNPLNLPDRDFHPARNDKLRLSHQRPRSAPRANPAKPEYTKPLRGAGALEQLVRQVC